VHATIQHDHLHLLVEVANADALSRGLRAFVRILTTPRAVRIALLRSTGWQRAGTIGTRGIPGA